MQEDDKVETIRLRLQPKQKEAFRKSFVTPVFFYGGAKGGAKSHTIRARQVYRRLKYPHTKGLIIRKTLPELISNHIRKFFTEYPQTKDWYSKSEKAIHWPNGSITEFSYLQNSDDVYNYQGREYDDIDVDEATQHKEEVIKVLRSSNRISDPAYHQEQKKLNPKYETIKPTMFLTGNPGGPGHMFCKRIFIDRIFRPEETPSDFDFLQAKVTDNKVLLESDPDYVKRLYDLPTHLRKAYLDGDWNIFAGMAFDELSESNHLIEPFILPQYTRYFAGYDHGYNHPFGYVLYALVPNGAIYCIGYLTGRLKGPDVIASEIKKLNNKREVQIFAGHDIFALQKDGTPSVDEQFMVLGVNMLHANIHREFGVSYMRKMFALKENGKPKIPTVKFFKNTIPVFNNIASMQYNGSKPEDVLKVDADENGEGGDDLYDAARYGLTSRATPIVTEKKPKPFSGEAVLDQLKVQRESEEDVGEYYS